MADTRTSENDFVNKLTSIIEENIGDEQFGVSELAREMNMSRSNLLRKVNKLTKLSVSQFIRQVRLKKALELLRQTALNVSEVSHQVGFGSTSYFIKCFREYYGYSPGTVGKRKESEGYEISENDKTIRERPFWKRRSFPFAAAGFATVLVVLLFLLDGRISLKTNSTEKSIAVLPFKNDSSDSTNLYLINGLMEATLNNLQKIGGLRVISRTSVEKYRNTTQAIPEMGKELNVSYFVEGSGQKVGDRILLNIQLIEASSDRHLWGRQYERQVKDIFELQKEIAESIAEEIEVVITPEEKLRIERKPTHDLVAYDQFLKGREEFYQGKREDLEASIPYFQKAVELDPEFALAYGELALVYYYLDLFQVEKKYGAQINNCADKALLYDSKLANSLVAKAVFYLNKREYEQAVPYLEKALEYNPNSSLVINFLSELYNNLIPNTRKYLEYALKGIQLDIGSQDSSSMSYNYLHLANALIQTGFIEEAVAAINKSLAYNPENHFSRWVRAFIFFAEDKDLHNTKQLLLDELHADTTRLHLVEEVGKVYYLLREYDTAYLYYKKFLEVEKAMELDLFRHENIKMAIVFDKMGEKEGAEELLKSFKQYADHEQSIYKNMNLAAYHSWKGETQKALEYLRLFSKEDNYQYWVLFWDFDAAFDPIRDLPEFKRIAKDIEDKFWNTHKEIRANLEKKNLI